MTPEEKAKELVEKMGNELYESNGHSGGAIECALIAVEEILKNAEQYTEWSIEEFKLTRQYEFWQEVKEEIEKIKKAFLFYNTQTFL